MHFKETDLPGIGRKYWLHTRSESTLLLWFIMMNGAIYSTWNLEIKRKSLAIWSLVTLDDDEARAVAAIVGGMTYKPQFQNEREVMLEGLLIEWLRIEPHAACIGKTIGEMNIRQVTGVAILAAVDKEKEKQFNPGRSTFYQRGDDRCSW